LSMLLNMACPSRLW